MNHNTSELSMNAYSSVAKLSYLAAREYRKIMTSAWIEMNGDQVQAGPFAGMRLTEESSWGEDILPMLLGTYEAELHCAISELLLAGHSLVINIGCAEGFYAIGFARSLPQARVVAFETKPRGQEICRKTAALNEIEQRVTVLGPCTTEILNTFLRADASALVFSDCEGAELELLSPAEVPGLVNADLIVECHDFIHTHLTELLIKRFEASHTVRCIYENGKLIDDFPQLGDMSSFDRAVATCEFRPPRMNWLYCKCNRKAFGL
jgi:hypothetical protein